MATIAGVIECRFNTHAHIHNTHTHVHRERHKNVLKWRNSCGSKEASIAF